MATMPGQRIPGAVSHTVHSLESLNPGLKRGEKVMLLIRIQWGPWIRIRIRNRDPVLLLKQENGLDIDLHSLESLNPALKHEKKQYCASGFNGILASGSGSQSRSRSRRAKITHKNRKKCKKIEFWGARCYFLRAEGFSCSLDVFLFASLFVPVCLVLEYWPMNSFAARGTKTICRQKGNTAWWIPLLSTLHSSRLVFLLKGRRHEELNMVSLISGSPGKNLF